MAFAARVFAVGNCIASEWPKDLDSIGISKQKHLHHGSDRSIERRVLLYWEYLPNPACHPKRLPKVPDLE